MDILKKIKGQVQLILKDKPDLKLNSIIVHIERADFFLEEGKIRKDEHLFTDVIYRTNHAFEGILKEAYKVLADKSEEEAAKKSPYQIEEYLLKNKNFNQRVLELFKNYRQEWRNPSTHEYNLFFNESEAFLAIINVSAFTHVLLNQINEKIISDKEKLIIDKKAPDLIESINNYQESSLSEKLKNILIKTSEKKLISTEDLEKREIDFIGILDALFSLDKDLEITREPKLKSNLALRPDFIISNKDEKVIVEVKKYRSQQSADNQLLKYLSIANINNGIIVYFGKKKDMKDFEIKKIIFEEKEYNILSFYL